MPRLVPLALFAGLLCCTHSAGADLPPAEVYRQTLRGTAWVITPAKGKGTGWIIDRGRKLLVTNLHVVADHETVDVLFPVCRDGRLVTERTTTPITSANCKRPAAPSPGGCCATTRPATWRWWSWTRCPTT